MDNKTIIIPNGGLSTGSINNYSLESYRRVDWKIGLSYGCDFEKAKEVFLDILLSDDRVVVDTLSEDMQKRKAILLEEVPENEEDCPEDDPDCVEEKRTLIQRLLRRRKKKTAIIKSNLRKKTTIPIQTDLNVSRPPFVSILELADSSVIFAVRAWTHTSNYWNLYFEMNQRFYTELPEKGFGFPFPQMDVHIADVPEGLLTK